MHPPRGGRAPPLSRMRQRIRLPGQCRRVAAMPLQRWHLRCRSMDVVLGSSHCHPMPPQPLPLVGPGGPHDQNPPTHHDHACPADRPVGAVLEHVSALLASDRRRAGGGLCARVAVDRRLPGGFGGVAADHGGAACRSDRAAAGDPGGGGGDVHAGLGRVPAGDECLDLSGLSHASGWDRVGYGPVACGGAGPA